MSIARTSHIAVLLANGKVLVSGGFAPPNSESLKDAEVYDPATNTWSPTGAMNARRAAFAAARLSDGRVLVAGGFADNLPLVSAEIYDPATGVWTATGAMAASRWAHTLTRLLNGKVLVVGGQSEGSSAEVYDLSTGTWAPTGSTSAFYIFHAATRLPDGKVLVSGGEINEAGASAEVYDPGTGAWTVTSPPGAHPARHKAVLLTNGKVLAAGGSTASAELYIATQVITRQSGSAQDGWALESSENSNQGGTVNATAATFLLGDDAARRQYRAVLSFNTAALPDNAVITRVILKIRKHSLIGTNPFTTHGKIAVDIRKGSFSNVAALQPTDFQAGSNKPNVGAFVNKPRAGGWYLTNLTATAFPFVHRAGLTQLRLRFQLDDDNDAVADLLRFYSGNAPAASRPVLVVEYYVP
jgi:hypothetical protein